MTAGRQQIVQLVDPVGAFLYTTIEPTDDLQHWKIHHRQLFKLLPDQQFPADIAAATNGRVKREDRPTRREVMQAVAHVCRYPTALITGDAERTVQLLTARQHVRFKSNASFRGFRTPKQYE